MAAAQAEVSVVIATYNYARFLPTSVESALAQTDSPLEVVVVDDGSTDHTPDLMRQYGADSRVRYLRLDHRGQSAAKNAGVTSSRGALVAFLDADDVWEPTKLAKQVAHFSRPDVGVVYSLVNVIDEAGALVPTGPPRGHLRPRSGSVTSHLLFDNFVPFSSAVVRRRCFDAAGGFDESLPMAPDWDLWLRMSLLCQFVAVPRRLARYRLGHADQISQRKRERGRVAEGILARFLECHPEAAPAATRRRLETHRRLSEAWHWREERQLRRSTQSYLGALRNECLTLSAYRGLVKNLFLYATRQA